MKLFSCFQIIKRHVAVDLDSSCRVDPCDSAADSGETWKLFLVGRLSNCHGGKHWQTLSQAENKKAAAEPCCQSSEERQQTDATLNCLHVKYVWGCSRQLPVCRWTSQPVPAGCDNDSFLSLSLSHNRNFLTSVAGRRPTGDLLPSPTGSPSGLKTCRIFTAKR